MAGDVTNPRVWLGADVYVAPVGTTAPTDVTTAFSASWSPLGLLGEDGMTEGREQDKTEHYAWGGGLVRTTRKKHKRTFTVTALEDTPSVWQLVNPGSTFTTSGGITTRTVKWPVPDPRAFAFELIDGDIVKRRIIPRGEVVEVGEITLNDSEMTGYELTIEAYPVNGDFYIDITDDPQAD